MPKLKIQFHLHTGCDPIDKVNHTEKELIDKAAELQYDVLCITCHNVVIFNAELFDYAKNKKILLIPGIEKSINRKHVLIINADKSAENITSFEDLKTYRFNRKECLTIAAHPFYPGPISLQEDLEKHIELFDAIEYSWYHSKKLNFYNKKAAVMAKKHGKPLIGNSDNHILKYLDETYSIIEAEKNIPSILEAIKKNHIEIVSNNLPWWKLFTIISLMLIMSYHKAFTSKKHISKKS